MPHTYKVFQVNERRWIVVEDDGIAYNVQKCHTCYLVTDRGSDTDKKTSERILQALGTNLSGK
jgi:hypothetical protein